MKVREKMAEILLGYGITVNEPDDDLTRYITDSLQFISFVVDVEAALNIEMPDYLLQYEALTSFNRLVERLEEIYEEGGEEDEEADKESP
ncbi:MAG: acyl carrier protein [Lachnospiraceae bacterium]|nr:acyl carrier protein [Lachnospiraceae bacterium]